MIVVLNNKSNFTKDEFLEYQMKLTNIKSKNNIVLCPSMPYISLYNLQNISLGVQNVSKNDSGAHTGEVSSKQLKSLNVKYAIVGHSERREELVETDEDIYNKIKKLIASDIIPILCIGETKEEREKELYLSKVGMQLDEVILKLDEKDQEKIIIAYEPIWSIGTGLIPSNEEIEEIFKFIKKYCPNNKVLYGGSASEKNIETLKQLEIIDGYLLGGISLDTERLQVFLNILEK